MPVSGERLREYLKVHDPKLYAALLRNWETAWEEWLPALTVSGGSFNSYPHIRNVEHHVDCLLVEGAAGASGDTPRLRVPLSPVEVYVLLASVLFHDIGRITPKGDHGVKSQKQIENSFPSLGIPSRELAGSIGRISAYHTMLERAGPFDRNLEDTVIDPYGRVRESVLGPLLLLADHLDSAYTRVLPDYLRPPGNLGPVGAFRDVIRGVEVDHKACLVRTVLGTIGIPPVDAPEPGFGYKVTKDLLVPGEKPLDFDAEVGQGVEIWSAERLTKHVCECEDVANKKQQAEEELKEELKKKPCNGGEPRSQDVLIWAMLKRLRECHKSRYKVGLAEIKPGHVLPLVQGPPLAKALLGKKGEFSALDWLLARQEIRLKRGEEAEIDFKGGAGWPPAKILAIIMGDVAANAHALTAIEDPLAAAGLPLRAWLIESKERLFNLWGQETFEPIFTRKYLEEVADKMWDLSTRIFGDSLFTYRSLADHLREPDVEKVRRAVRRISVVTRHLLEMEKELHLSGELIWAGDERWRWNCGRPDAAGPEQWCDTVTLEGVKNRLGELGEPA
jgi:hypothetical protein